MDYCSPAGNNLIQEWYEDLLPQARADFDTTLKTLAIASEWRELKQFKALGKGLGEIRFKSGGVQYRPAGYFGPGARTFSIYVGCHKKQNIYDPPNAFELAAKRKAKVEAGEGSLCERAV
jgi:hypothetical protein